MCLFIKSKEGKVPEFSEVKEAIVAYAFRIKNSDGSIESPLHEYIWLKGVVEYLGSDKQHLDDLIMTRHVDLIQGQYINNLGETISIDSESGFGEYVLTNKIFHLLKNKSDATHLMKAFWCQNLETLQSDGRVLVLCEFVIPAGAMFIEGHSMFMETGHCEDRYESYGTTAAMLSNIIGE